MTGQRGRDRKGGVAEGEEGEREGRESENMADEFTSELAFMWQMYTMHTNIRWYIQATYKMNSG